MTVEPAPLSWTSWLLADAPASRSQARLGRWYANWLALHRNPLAVSGLVIVLALVLMAIVRVLIPRRNGRLAQPVGFRGSEM